MDNMDMSSQETPPNINEPYANNLITIIASIIAFLTLRHLLTYKRSVLVYQPIENYVINLFSYSFINIPIGAILLIIALISAILPLLLLNVDLTVNSNRAGFLGLALVPFILSSTGKNSALSLLTGISSVRLNFIHRILATALFLCVTVHMACMLYAWSKFPIFMQSQLQVQKVQYGLAGYGSLCVVMVGSFFLVRKMCYEVFVVTHLFIFGFIGAIALHTPYAMRYFIAGLVCYLLNLVAVWFIKSHIGRARFHVLPGGCTKVSIRLASPLKQHSIGQHINLCIPSIGSAFQWHPFTITSISCPKNNDMVEVHVCARGNFTRSLYNTTRLEQDVPVFLNGPFGDSQIQPGVILDNYNTVVIALGGAGATFGIRLLRELYSHLSKITKQTTCTRDIYVVWSVRRVSELAWFQQELERYNYTFNHSNTPFPKLHLKLHITGQGDSIDTPSTTTEKEVPEGIDITPDKLNTLMDNDTNRSAIKEADIVYQSRLNPNDYLLACTGNAGVFVCGPPGFNSSFKNAVASSSMDKSSHIQLFCQDFSY
ncbi:uncharacterized protein RHIMIDRAFT_234952 [Rhizopus microsporus ATCC 52813]|uniref:ferric-chelate reductase (NADPH) n=2 Tax=Rhizopus microsporus TaxID=58291 RepID=A0A2G4T3M2_RHIZD|nr:uncharacterized protein RHIMIDRAFT_234952 [Rhizopus microsporus ATCC 52813]PHZ15612.1 hypothetical protein RHIMIDRAFT_234952 [Rhizopus microsporus ATCC 52813]